MLLGAGQGGSVGEDWGQMRETTLVLPTVDRNEMYLINGSAVSGCGELGQLRPTVAVELRGGPGGVFLHLRTPRLGD